MLSRAVVVGDGAADMDVAAVRNVHAMRALLTLLRRYPNADYAHCGIDAWSVERVSCCVARVCVCVCVCVCVRVCVCV